MKIRIKGNTIRLRLVQAEVRALSAGNTISECTVFGERALFVYALIPSATHDTITAKLVGSDIHVFLPEAIAQAWYENDLISLSAIQENGLAGGLKILIEKDFACLDHTDEDQSDNYPNPNRGKAC